MRVALITWEEFPDTITYTVGFLVRENRTDLRLASDYDAVSDRYKDTITIPLRSIRERRVFNPKTYRR